MILSSEIADLLNEAEVRFPVDSWKVAGVDAWPLLRIRYGFGMVEEHGYRAAAGSRTARALDAFRGPFRRVLASIQDHSRNASLSAPADVLLLSNGISYANVEGVWHDRFCDPIIREIEQHNLRCLLLSPLHAYRVPRRTPSHFIQPELDRAALRSLSPSAQPLHLPEFDGFQGWAEARNRPAPPLGWLRQACTRVRQTADFFARILQNTGAALGVAVNYYSPVGMAFVLACRERGLPVVDLQHGVGGNLHFAYGRWVRVPAGGFDLLPTHFWCWDAESAAAIRAWATDGHTTLVGGNPWLSYWQDASAPHVREADARIRALKAQHPSAIHALLTLQFPALSEQTRATLDSVRSSGPDIFWWIRLHPRLLADRKHVAAHLGLTNRVEIDAATHLALPALLRHVDVHVTHSSSTVLEAATLGVQSVITSRYGAELYPAQLRSGMAVAVPAADMTGAVREQSRRKRSLPLDMAAQAHSAVQELLLAAKLLRAGEIASDVEVFRTAR